MPVLSGTADEPNAFDDDRLDRLTPIERRIMQLRYGLIDGKRRTLESVAGRFRMTAERVRQLEQQALEKMARPD